MKRTNNKKGIRGSAGFTLIELVMVIVILGILAVVAIPRYLNMQQEARDAAAEGYIGGLQSALSLHIADHYLNGTAWVANATECEALLGSGSERPNGMTLGGNTWAMAGGDSWSFVASAGTDPPNITKN